MQTLIMIIIMLFSSQIYAAQYDYNKLRFTNFDELRAVKTSAIKASRKINYEKDPQGAQRPLQEALRMFYSRPNQDNTIRTLSEDIEADLKMMSLFEPTIQNILAVSEETLNDSSLPSNVRATAILCMNNALTEIKPQILHNAKLARVVCEMADRKIKIPKEIQADTKLHSMMLQASPSDTAKRIMQWYAKQKDVKVSNTDQGCPFSKKAT